jgi:hypothetical protein
MSFGKNFVFTSVNSIFFFTIFRCKFPLKENYLKSDCDSSIYKVKGKAIPLQALTGPEGSRMLKFPDFKTIDT